MMIPPSSRAEDGPSSRAEGDDDDLVPLLPKTMPPVVQESSHQTSSSMGLSQSQTSPWTRRSGAPANDVGERVCLLAKEANNVETSPANEPVTGERHWLTTPAQTAYDGLRRRFVPSYSKLPAHRHRATSQEKYQLLLEDSADEIFEKIPSAELQSKTRTAVSELASEPVVGERLRSIREEEGGEEEVVNKQKTEKIRERATPVEVRDARILSAREEQIKARMEERRAKHCATSQVGAPSKASC